MRPPPIASPSLPPYTPQTEGEMRSAHRTALMLRFHPRFLTVLTLIPTYMNDILVRVKNKLVEVEVRLYNIVYSTHLLGRKSLNVNICRLP